MFKFDVRVDECDKDDNFNDTFYQKDSRSYLYQEETSSLNCHEATEILPSQSILDNVDVYRLQRHTKILKNVCISHLSGGFLLGDISNASKSDIKKAHDQHSDLVPGVYEGGAKIWEYTDDILNFMAEMYSQDWWTPKRVLDLGCGAGLVDIYAYKQGARVDFQDCVCVITIPNLLINITEQIPLEQVFDNVKFYSGNWSESTESCKGSYIYDVILTSETIYNPRNQDKLLRCLKDKSKLNGVDILAAKTQLVENSINSKHY
ncbi:histidine protein methyltransferase 1 homolog [Glossina fuscipes]|uniref:protein-histidine N-methyltransferase n=1 Tax=Glossina fuscipes TaxID=7396 RepID=A0A9C6DU41_9MUSC|nr:histidine protein methyltransferase 1 homolog [Glossina fuscipes]